MIDGIFKIVDMPDFDSEYLAMEIEPYIKVDGKTGEFKFGLVEGDMILNKVDDIQAEFIWNGNDELDAVFGSGTLKLLNESELIGEIAFNNGEVHELLAIKL